MNWLLLLVRVFWMSESLDLLEYPPQFARSQSHGIFATTQLPAAIAVTWSNGLGSRFSLIPIDAAFDCSCVISDVIHDTPVAYGKLKLSPVPFLIPGPHLAGSVQVLTPSGTTFQPWLASRFFALPGLYGN